MGQRTKAMDTESPTSKFLYSIIKQVDLKIVDWNTVARDIGISNGHAARMRYSRFKGQIDPSKVKKKTPKKGEKGDLKGSLAMPMHLQHRMDFATINSGPVPKTEPMDTHCQQHPFVKCEPDHRVPGEGNLPDGREAVRNLAYSRSSGNMAPPPHVSQYVPNSLPFSGAPSLPGLMPFSNSIPLAPYSMIPMSQEIRMDEFNMHSPFINHAPMMNNGPMIGWEPTSAPSRDNTPVAPRSESHPASLNNAPIVPWEPTSAPPREDSPGVPRSESTQVSVHHAPVIAWEPTPGPSREHTSVAPRSESTPVSVNNAPIVPWEPTSAPPREHSPEVPGSESTHVSVHHAPVITWEPTPVPPREHTAVAPRSVSTPVSVKEEPETTQSKIDVAVPIKVEETGEKE